MTERLIDLSERAARLSVRHEQLVITSGGEETTTPMDELAVLVVSNPAVTYTQAVLSGLMDRGGVFICCDARRLPSGMMLPLEGHHLQTERLRYQVEASQPVRKQAWRQVVQAKIAAQGRLLQRLHGNDRGLLPLSARVRSGDPENLEGQAAKRYWPALFQEARFRRQQNAPAPNNLLDYGYAVLRGIVARSIVAAGLHPSIGIHHHNRYDAFCLADDLMEPFRPLVDAAVVRILEEYGPDAPLDKDTKRILIGALMERFEVQGEARSLFDITAITAVSLVKVFQGTRKKLILPEL